MIKYFIFSVATAPFCWGLLACQSTPAQVQQIDFQAVLPTDTVPVSPIFGDTVPIDRSAAYITGKFDPTTLDYFVEIDTQYADRAGLFLRKDTYDAFVKMWVAARQDDVALVIRSATRNFDMQKSIWERKWSGETILSGGISASTITDTRLRALEILKYSSMPGTSRHHWGTDIDLNAFNNDYFSTGDGLKMYEWMVSHAPSFGFCQPYTEKGVHRPAGYEEEKWHWSYLPVSHILLTEAKITVNNSMINGFKGSEEAVNIDVLNSYILGVDSSCITSF